MSTQALQTPLRFSPVYQKLVWGGRRMEAWRGDLPEGPIGESWDLADHDRGMSVVAAGPLKGKTLRELVRNHPEELVGRVQMLLDERTLVPSATG